MLKIHAFIFLLHNSVLYKLSLPLPTLGQSKESGQYSYPRLMENVSYTLNVKRQKDVFCNYMFAFYSNLVG